MAVDLPYTMTYKDQTIHAQSVAMLAGAHVSNGKPLRFRVSSSWNKEFYNFVIKYYTLPDHQWMFADSFTDLVSRLQVLEEKSEGAPILNIVKGLPPPLEGVERCLSIDEEAIRGEEPWELLSRN